MSIRKSLNCENCGLASTYENSRLALEPVQKSDVRRQTSEVRGRRTGDSPRRVNWGRRTEGEVCAQFGLNTGGSSSQQLDANQSPRTARGAKIMFKRRRNMKNWAGKAAFGLERARRSRSTWFLPTHPPLPPHGRGTTPKAFARHGGQAEQAARSTGTS